LTFKQVSDEMHSGAPEYVYTLSDLLYKTHPSLIDQPLSMSVTDCRQLCLDIASGLQHLQSKQLLRYTNGILMPEDVFVFKQNGALRARVSKKLNKNGAASSRFQSVLLVDTCVKYRAPEYIVRKVQHHQETSDSKPMAILYSLSILIFEIFTRASPYDTLKHTSDVASVILQDIALKGRRPWTDRAWPQDVSKKLKHMVESCGHGDPAKRPSIQHLMTALEKVV